MPQAHDPVRKHCRRGGRARRRRRGGPGRWRAPRRRHGRRPCPRHGGTGAARPARRARPCGRRRHPAAAGEAARGRRPGPRHWASSRPGSSMAGIEGRNREGREERPGRGRRQAGRREPRRPPLRPPRPECRPGPRRHGGRPAAGRRPRIARGEAANTARARGPSAAISTPSATEPGPMPGDRDGGPGVSDRRAHRCPGGAASAMRRQTSTGTAIRCGRRAHAGPPPICGSALRQDPPTERHGRALPFAATGAGPAGRDPARCPAAPLAPSRCRHSRPGSRRRAGPGAAPSPARRSHANRRRARPSPPPGPPAPGRARRPDPDAAATPPAAPGGSPPPGRRRGPGQRARAAPGGQARAGSPARPGRRPGSPPGP